MTDRTKTHWAEVVSFSDVGFENSDGEIYTFGSDTYLGKVASISHGLRDDASHWLKIGETMILLDKDDKQRLEDHAALLANQPKYKKEPSQD